jgi:hypothetical protein
MTSRPRSARRALLAPVVLGMVAVLGACQPDLSIRKAGSGTPYKGKGVINTTGVNQTVARKKGVGNNAIYEIRLKNITTEACSMQLKDGVVVNGGTYLRKWNHNGQNITALVTGPSGYVIPNLAAGAETTPIKLRVQPESGVAGNELLVGLKAVCQSNTNIADVVRALTKIT